MENSWGRGDEITYDLCWSASSISDRMLFQRLKRDKRLRDSGYRLSKSMVTLNCFQSHLYTSTLTISPRDLRSYRTYCIYKELRLFFWELSPFYKIFFLWFLLLHTQFLLAPPSFRIFLISSPSLSFSNSFGWHVFKKLLTFCKHNTPTAILVCKLRD